MFAGEDPSAPRLASGTKGRAVVRTCGGRRNLEATRLARPTRPCRRVGRAMPDERFRRRGYYGSYSRTATWAERF